MNQKQKDTLEGFAALLTMAGQELTWGAVPFTALVRDEPAREERFDLTPGDDEEATVATFAHFFPGPVPGVGEIFQSLDGEHYRVFSVRRDAGGQVIRFRCEVTHP